MLARADRLREYERRREHAMAIYEFECTGCGQRFEVTRPMHEHNELMQHPPACPQCGKAQTREVAPLIGYKAPSS
jgi:putative FmdB family regulatory protein